MVSFICKRADERDCGRSKTMLKEHSLVDKERISALAQELGMTENDLVKKLRKMLNLVICI